jgi:hypothetical protein
MGGACLVPDKPCSVAILCIPRPRKFKLRACSLPMARDRNRPVSNGIPAENSVKNKVRSKSEVANCRSVCKPKSTAVDSWHRNRCGQVLQLLAKTQAQAGESLDECPNGQVRPLDVAGT